MRQQIAAANWKMNCTYQQGEQLLSDILSAGIVLPSHRKAIFAVPAPYLLMADDKVAGKANYAVAAQNCYHKKSGAYTGEISVDMLASIEVSFCVIGHSERR